MDRRQLFTKNDLLDLSEITQNQYRKLQEHNLIEVSGHLGFFLNELIYCRLIFLLRKEYSLQELRDFLLPLKSYGDDLITKNYGVLVSAWDYPMQLSLLENLKVDDANDDDKFMIKLINKQLESCYFYHQISSYQPFDNSELYKIGRFYINLKLIREQLKQKAKILNINHIDQKFNCVA
jgi:hypothetical protein